MIRIQCPGCSRKLGIPDALAGRPAVCPQCKHKFRVPPRDAPAADEEAGEERVVAAPRPAASPKKRPVAEDEDERTAKASRRPVEGDAAVEPPAESDQAEQDDEHDAAPLRKRKKKRARRRPTKSEPGLGRLLVIIICAVVLGVHVLGLISYLATPDPVEIAKQQAREAYQKIGKDLPKDIQQKQEQDLDKVMQGAQQDQRVGQIIGLVWMVVNFGLSATLLAFLFLRYNWARLVLGVLFLIGAGLGLLAIPGTVVLLALFPTGAAILLVVDLFIRVVVSLGIGLLLILSPSVAAYTRR